MSRVNDFTNQGPIDITLGNALLNSAITTENAVAGILIQEAAKFARFNTLTANVEQIQAFDETLARILEALCCIEGAVVAKVNAGLILRGNTTPLE